MLRAAPSAPCPLLPQLVGQLAASLAVIEVAYLGLLWHETGDLAAPLAAALAAGCVDFWYIRRALVPQRLGR